MDMFIDKLAQRQTAHEIIKANTEADTKELNNFKNQVAGYNECLVKLQRLIDEGFVKLARIRIDRDDTARIVEESIGRAKNLYQDTEKLEHFQGQLDAISGMLREISARDTGRNAGGDEMTHELLVQVESSLQNLLGEIAKGMQEQLGSMNQSVQEKFGSMGRAMQEQLERMGDIIQLQLKGMDKTVREQVSGMGVAIQEQLGNVGSAVQEQCGNVDNSMQEQLENVGGRMQNRIGSLDKSIQEQFIGVNKSMQEQFTDMSKQLAGMNKAMQAQLAGMDSIVREQLAGIHTAMQEQLNNMDKLLKGSMEEQFGGMARMLEDKFSRQEGQEDDGAAAQLSESIHKECVKVYRNVQAVMVEESGKQSEALAEAKAGIVSLKGKFGIILGISVAAMVCSLAGVAFQILNSLNLIP